MKYQVIRDSSGLTVTFTGSLNFTSFAPFAGVLEELERPGSDGVVFDLSAVAHVDSAGLGLLFMAREELDRRGRRLCLARPQSEVRRLLELTDAVRCFEIVN